MSRTHVSHVQLRVADLNWSGHMDNISILRLVDEVRTHFLGHVHDIEDGYTGGLIQVCGPGVGIMVGQQIVEYQRELWYDAGSPAHVEMWLSHIGTASFVAACQIRQDAAAPVAVISEASIVMLDWQARLPWRITEPVREAFAEFLGPALRFRPRAR